MWILFSFKSFSCAHLFPSQVGYKRTRAPFRTSFPELAVPDPYSHNQLLFFWASIIRTGKWLKNCWTGQARSQPPGTAPKDNIRASRSLCKTDWSTLFCNRPEYPAACNALEAHSSNLSGPVQSLHLGPFPRLESEKAFLFVFSTLCAIFHSLPSQPP